MFNVCWIRSVVQYRVTRPTDSERFCRCLNHSVGSRPIIQRDINRYGCTHAWFTFKRVAEILPDLIKKTYYYPLDL